MNTKGRIVASLVVSGFAIDAWHGAQGMTSPDYKSKHTPPAQTIMLGTGTATSASASAAIVLTGVDMVSGQAFGVLPHRRPTVFPMSFSGSTNLPTWDFEVDRG